MGIRTGNPEWKDYPDTSTRVYAQHLNAIEDALDNSAPVSASMGVVYHTTADAPRPDYAAVYWVGELEPINALPGDIWRNA